MKKKQPRDKKKKWSFLKTFLAGFVVCGAGLDLLTLLFEGLTSWALDQLLVKAVGSAIASFLTLLARPIIRSIFRKNGGKTMKFFKKIDGFFKRVGQYLKSNKRTLGGIITSVLTGTMATTVCVCGYTFDLTEVIAQVSWLEWVKQVSVNGFDLTPILVGVIIWLIAVWNAVAAVSRGWESPEKCEAENEAKKQLKASTKTVDSETETETETVSETSEPITEVQENTVPETKPQKTEVAISSTVPAGSAKAVSALDALIAKQNADTK